MNKIIGEGTISLIGFLGAIVILLWGVRMIRKGAEKILLPHINTTSPVFQNKIYALIYGIFGAAILQSSTALVLIVSSIATKITIPLAVGLAFVLGADVGSALASQLFTFNIKSISPLLLLIGFMFQRTAKKEQKRQHIGQMLMGFGFILYALTSIGAFANTIKSSEILASVFFNVLVNDIALALFIAILLTWLAHSSLAIVLMTVELINSNVIPINVGITLVLGANIGACLPAYTDSIGLPIEARRLTFGNVIFRLCGGALVLPFISIIAQSIVFFPVTEGRFLTLFHLVFNIFVASVFMFFLKPIEKIICKVFREPEKISHKGVTTKFLRSEDIENPSLAITNLIKEVFRMSENIYIMIDRVYRSLLQEQSSDTDDLKELLKLEKQTNGLSKSITKYLQRTYAASLNEEQSFSTMLINAYCTDLEQVGDIVSNTLYESLQTKNKKHIKIPDSYRKEFESLFKSLQENIILSQEIFVRHNLDEAELLLQKKDVFKKTIVDNSLLHKQRRLKGEPESIAMSSIYLDIIHDLRRINAHITAVAYPVIERTDNALEL